MPANLVNAALSLLRERWPALLAVAALTLGPTVAATALIEVLGPQGVAITNGSIVTDREIASWTQVELSATGGDAQVRVSVPLLPALAWFVGLGTALRVLAGAPVRSAWRHVHPAWLAEWVGFGVLFAALALLGLYASVAVAGFVGRPIGVLTAALWTYGLIRLARALPAMLVDGLHLPGALRHALATIRGRAELAGTALVLATVGLPVVVLALLDPEIMPTGQTWVADVLWSSVVTLLEYATLVVALPLVALGLLVAYRLANPIAPDDSTDDEASDDEEASDDDESSADTERSDDEESTAVDSSGPEEDERDLTVTVHDLVLSSAGTYGLAASGATAPIWVDSMASDRTEPDVLADDGRGAPIRTRPALRRLRLGAVALLAVVPAAVGPTLLLANPNDLPVMTIARPEAGFSSRPLVMTVLADGTVVSVDSAQAALCRDAHCTDLDLLTMPCYDGEPTPEAAAVRSCPTEGPLVAADVTPDGTLLALTRGRDQEVRLFWCRLEPTEDGQCRWGGATTLYQQPEQAWSMDVAALPDGGFAATIVGAGPDEARASVWLLTCERLDCPQPTVHLALTVPRPTRAGPGLVDVAADPMSGTLAVGYVDVTDGSLYLGGCRAGCPDGPLVTLVGQWPEFAEDAPTPVRPVLQVLATADAPAATLGAIDANETAALVPPQLAVVLTCYSWGCGTSDFILWHRLVSAATLVATQAGGAYLVGSAGASNHVTIGPVRGEWLAAFATVPGTVVTAALGPDDRLRLLSYDDHGPMVVTVDRSCCLPSP